jgi:hypothetical protein
VEHVGGDHGDRRVEHGREVDDLQRGEPAADRRLGGLDVVVWIDGSLELDGDLDVGMQDAGVGQDDRRTVVVAGRAHQVADSDRAVEMLAFTQAQLPSDRAAAGPEQLVPARELLAEGGECTFHQCRGLPPVAPTTSPLM